MGSAPARFQAAARRVRRAKQQVLPGLGLVGEVAQQVGGMVGHDDRRGLVVGAPSRAGSPRLASVASRRIGGGLAEGHDDAAARSARSGGRGTGAHAAASSRRRRAVARRAALHHVGDVDLAPALEARCGRAWSRAGARPGPRTARPARLRPRPGPRRRTSTARPRLPTPNTACLRLAQSPHAVHVRTASRSSSQPSAVTTGAPAGAAFAPRSLDQVVEPRHGRELELARASARPSQREPEEERVLASRQGGVVLGADRDLLESHRAVEVARRVVRWAHLEIDDLAAPTSRATSIMCGQEVPARCPGSATPPRSRN